jgi:redox-sensitive bicupin YhaK (pirin superfamily)
MIIRKGSERGKNNFGWLEANHSFSFGHYYDPKWTNFHKLLVINQDKIAPSMGFGTHPHRDMEIITYIIEGEIKHQDSMGSTGHIKPGEIQVMSAGTGVTHSEFNHKNDQTTHLLQIWIEPSFDGLKPRYAEKKVFKEGETNFLKNIAGTLESENSIKLNAEGAIWLGKFDRAKSLEFSPTFYDHFWLQLIEGDVEINGVHLSGGDAVGIENCKNSQIKISVEKHGAHFLIFEVN